MTRPCCWRMSPAPASTPRRRKWCSWPCTACAVKVTRPSSSWRMILPLWTGPIRCWIYGTSTVPRADQMGLIAHESLYYRLEIHLGTLADQCADRPIGRLRGQPDPGHLSADAWHPGQFYPYSDTYW